jgi:SPP1 gp7 family putative phage head morphogenesis protein
MAAGRAVGSHATSGRPDAMSAEFGELPKRLEKSYARAISRLVKRLIPKKRSTEPWEEWIRRIQARSNAVAVQEAAGSIALEMVRWVDVINARTWRAASSRSQQSRMLYQLLMQQTKGAVGAHMLKTVRENASLISSIPLEAAQVLTNEVLAAQQAGSRATTIAIMMRSRFPELLKSRVNLIARTETAKASTALTRARCDELGVEFYIWRSSKDQRVRDSHRKMDGVVVPWAQPPSPEALIGEASTLGRYHAGECPNCRCTQIVVLTLEDVSWPATVYWQGRLQKMKRIDFQRISHVEEIAA